MIPLSPFNQRLPQSERGDGAVRVIVGYFRRPPHPKLSHSLAVRTTGEASSISLLHHHQPQNVFIDCLLCAGYFAGCRKGKLEISPRFWIGAHLYLEVSYLLLKWVTESFVKGHKRSRFYKEKWSRLTGIVRLLCGQFLPNAGKRCRYNYSTAHCLSQYGKTKPAAACTACLWQPFSPDFPQHCQYQWEKCLHNPVPHWGMKCENWI